MYTVDLFVVFSLSSFVVIQLVIVAIVLSLKTCSNNFGGFETNTLFIGRRSTLNCSLLVDTAQLETSNSYSFLKAIVRDNLR